MKIRRKKRLSAHSALDKRFEKEGFSYQFSAKVGALAMVLGGTTAEYNRKFATAVVTHINQTDEEQAILEHNAHVESLEKLATDLRNCLEHTTDEKYKRYLALKIDRTNQRLEQLQMEEVQ